jgi:tetratricopeptide (TPR) repeat protein
MWFLDPKRIALVFLLLTCAGATAQVIPQRVTNVNLLIRVTFSDDRAAGDQIRVELISESGVPVGETFTDSNGRASFRVTSPGMFEVRASGSSVQGTATERFRIDDMDKNKTVFVRIKPKAEATATQSKPSAPPVTSAADLRAPAEARKAFHKGMEAWDQHDFAKAAEHFEKAVALFPEYDTAYNNLGVMYFQLNQTDKAKAAFERSVALNDKNADADRNLARILLQESNSARAQELLTKSLVVEPLNPVTLTLLCVADMQTGNYDGALTTARKTHQLPHEGYSLVHFMAGQALEQKGQPQDAFAEYQTYLQESPAGAEAPLVRNAVARLSASNQPHPQ